MSVFEDTYRAAIGAVSGAHGIYASSDYIQKVNSAIDCGVELIQAEGTRVQNVGIKFSKGNMAEAYHASTFNVTAVANGRGDVSAEMLNNNKIGQDIRYGKLGLDERMAELKYYSDGEKTAKALSNFGYSSGHKVVPEDQLSDVRHAAAKEALRNKDSRPDVSESNAHTAKVVSDRLEFEGVSSRPLSHQDSVNLAKESKSNDGLNPDDYGLVASEFVDWSNIAREAGQAALHAAAFSAALTAAPYLAKTIACGIKRGEIDVGVLSEGVAAVVTSTPLVALRASIAAAIVSASKVGYCGEAMKGMSPSAVGMATVMAVNSIGYSIRYAKGELAGNEMVVNCIKDSIALASGLIGASLGGVILPIPIMGALIGNVIGATIGAAAFQGVHSVTLGICAESGWTMFGLVDQEYKVPEDVLQQCGFDLINLDRIGIQRFSPQKINISKIDENTVGIIFLRRGVVGMSAIGFV